MYSRFYFFQQNVNPKSQGDEWIPWLFKATSLFVNPERQLNDSSFFRQSLDHCESIPKTDFDVFMFTFDSTRESPIHVKCREEQNKKWRTPSNWHLVIIWHLVPWCVFAQPSLCAAAFCLTSLSWFPTYEDAAWLVDVWCGTHLFYGHNYFNENLAVLKQSQSLKPLSSDQILCWKLLSPIPEKISLLFVSWCLPI